MQNAMNLLVSSRLPRSPLVSDLGERTNPPDPSDRFLLETCCLDSFVWIDCTACSNIRICTPTAESSAERFYWSEPDRPEREIEKVYYEKLPRVGLYLSCWEQLLGEVGNAPSGENVCLQYFCPNLLGLVPLFELEVHKRTHCWNRHCLQKWFKNCVKPGGR